MSYNTSDNTSDNIRFTVHNNDRNAIDPMFRMLSMLAIVTPMFSISEDRVNNIGTPQLVPSLSSQLYDTTDKKYDSCLICTEEYTKTDNVSVLKCGHVYHPKCIREWCKHKTCCPMCKESIPTVKRYSAR